MEHLSLKEIDPKVLYWHVSTFRNHLHMDLQHRDIFPCTKAKSLYPVLTAAVPGVEWKQYLLELAANSDYVLFCIFLWISFNLIWYLETLTFCLSWWDLCPHPGLSPEPSFAEALRHEQPLNLHQREYLLSDRLNLHTSPFYVSVRVLGWEVLKQTELSPAAKFWHAL